MARLIVHESERAAGPDPASTPDHLHITDFTVRRPIAADREIVLAGTRLWNPVTGQLMYGPADLVPVDELDSLINDHDHQAALRGGGKPG